MEVQYTPKNSKHPISIVANTPEEAIETAENIWRSSHLDSDEITIVDYPLTPTIRDTLTLRTLSQFNNTRFNPNGLKNHLLMLEEGKVTNAQFWETIKKIDWSGDLDYKRISNAFGKGVYGNKGFAIGVSYKFDKLKKELKNSIDNQLKRKELDYVDVIGLADDGFDDLCSNIIGLGEETYKKALEDPVFAGKCGSPESFSYAFQFGFL